MCDSPDDPHKCITMKTKYKYRMTCINKVGPYTLTPTADFTGPDVEEFTFAKQRDF